MLYVLLPAWVLAGIAGWVCRYPARIECSSGWRESLAHLTLLAKAGIAMAAGRLLEMNGGVPLVILVCFVAHEAAGYWNVRFDWPIALTFTALGLVLVRHWPAALSIVGMGPEPFDKTLKLKAEPLAGGYVLAIVLVIVLFNGISYAQDSWRGLKRTR